ncbi:gag-polypeptide of LTR copia-type domain-containing protein [Phthorimaea operculella]|nr:gag-polypeptide of LTR copia-type domain-containing protein [Phthorimaea operculella]
MEDGGSASSTSSSAVRLRGAENWAVWRFQTQIVLKGRGLMDIVSGVTKCPEESKAELVKDWHNKDAKAQEILVTRIEEEPLTYLFSCNTSNDMWEKLKSVYDKESTVSVHLLQQKFFSMKVEDTESLSKYFARLEELKMKLKLAGEAISDNMIITKILMTLPETYKHFRSAWESVPTDKQTLSELITRLLLEEERGSATSSEEAVALAAHGKRVNPKTYPVRCYNCNSPGHYAKACQKKETRECYLCKRRDI